MQVPRPLIILLDVDNTLLDNDRFQADLVGHIGRVLGEPQRERYQALLEQLRGELGYVDYLGAMQKLRLAHLDEPAMLSMSAYLLDYPFAERLYPGSIEALCNVQRVAPAVILSDGDAIFQPHKIQRAGLWRAVEGRVLIYVHKQAMLDEVCRHFPADHYVMVDDKPAILAAIKLAWGERVTTVFVRQGHYAHDTASLAKFAPADVTIEKIAELARFDAAMLRAASPIQP